MTSPDITLFLPSLTPGGAPRIMINIGEYLDKQGYNVEFVLARKEGEFLSDVQDLTVIGFDSRVIRSVLPLARYLRRKKPDVLLSTPHVANIVAIWAQKLARVETKVVVREPTTLSNQAREFTSIKDKLIPPLVKRSYPHADQFIAISEGVKRELVDNIGVDGSSVKVIYNPIVTPDIEPKSWEPVDHPWFGDTDVPVILGAGRLTQQKDFHTMIRAFNSLQNKRDARLVILGEGSDRPKLEKLVAKLELGDRIDLHGYVNNPYKFMRQSDVFTLSSAWEGFGNVIVEAMVCGTTVVATDCESGPAEILRDGKYGFLAPVGDHEQLAHKLATAIDDPLDEKLVQERAQDFALENKIPEYKTVLK